MSILFARWIEIFSSFDCLLSDHSECSPQNERIYEAYCSVQHRVEQCLRVSGDPDRELLSRGVACVAAFDTTPSWMFSSGESEKRDFAGQLDALTGLTNSICESREELGGLTGNIGGLRI